MSTRRKLDINNIGNWPQNFMGDAFGETAQAERARLARQRGRAAE